MICSSTETTPFRFVILISISKENKTELYTDYISSLYLNKHINGTEKIVVIITLFVCPCVVRVYLAKMTLYSFFLSVI